MLRYNKQADKQGLRTFNLSILSQWALSGQCATASDLKRKGNVNPDISRQEKIQAFPNVYILFLM